MSRSMHTPHYVMYITSHTHTAHQSCLVLFQLGTFERKLGPAWLAWCRSTSIKRTCKSNRSTTGWVAKGCCWGLTRMEDQGETKRTFGKDKWLWAKSLTNQQMGEQPTDVNKRGTGFRPAAKSVDENRSNLQISDL